MSRRSDHARLLVGLLASLLAHVLLLVPALLVAMISTRGTPLMTARFDPEDFARPPEPEPRQEPDVALGIDAPTPSSLTWVGYREYERHLAALAEIDQAAFARNAPGAEPNPPPAPAPADGEPAPQVPRSTDAPEAIEEPEPADAARPAPDVPLPMEGMAAETPLASDLRALERLLAMLPMPRLAPERPDAVTAPETAPRSPEIAEDAGEGTPAAGAPRPPAEPSEAVRSAPATPADDPQAPPGRSETEGDPADKESDATSVIEVPIEDIQRGKPLARPGLEVKPQRPRLTTLTKMTAAPCNPLVRIRFGRDGRPALAELLRTSCNRAIDHAVQSSLYRWRASGPEIDTLRGEETVEIELEIILNPRRRD